MRIIGILVALAAAGLGNAVAAVSEFQLDNGLKLIVKEDHRAPIVVSQVWYKVGSSYEHDGITGVSHVLEHMMFKGTQKHPAGEFSRIIAENGGRENAFTSRDYTAYFQTMERSRLPISFELEADRMRNLLVPDEEVAKEVQVVIEERRLRTEDKPESLTYERFNAVAYLSSPYRIPVIGWMNDLDNLNTGDLKQWYQRWYAPNNATVVVAGDVDPKEVYALAKQHFGSLKPSDIEPQKPRLEFKQQGPRRVTVRAPAEVPYLLMGYKVPVLLTAEEEWEPYALEVLTGVLDGGNSARMDRELVRGTQIAVSAGAGYSLYGRLGGLLMLEGNPGTGHSMEELEKALREQAQRLHEELVTGEELNRVKAQVVAAKVYERDSQFYQAMQIGTLETVGLDWRVQEEYVEKIQAVSAEQIREVAKKYLVEEGLTVAVLDPLPMENGKPAAGGDHGHH